MSQCSQTFSADIFRRHLKNFKKSANKFVKNKKNILCSDVYRTETNRPNRQVKYIMFTSEIYYVYMFIGEKQIDPTDKRNILCSDVYRTEPNRPDRQVKHIMFRCL